MTAREGVDAMPRMWKRTVGRMIGLGGPLVAAATIPLGGCVAPAKYDEAVRENEELRDRLDEEIAQREMADARAAALESDMARLEAERDRLRAAAATPRESPTRISASEGVEVSRRGSDIVVAVAGDVLFDPGSAELKAAARQTLQRIAREIRASYSSSDIRVEGHTDPDPITKSKWKSNEHLSAERALTVEAFLVAQGLPNDRVHSVAFGPARPRDSKARSRRVEIVIVGG